MTNNYLLKDLDEFKIRYVKKRIEDKLYARYSNNDIVIHCYSDSKDSYTHKFIGCIIEKLNGISIHKLMWLPMKAKIKIINSVIDDLEELMNNHVYHKDFS